MAETRKLFVLSDVHGHYTEMKKALDEAGFDPASPSHLLVFCGDMTDRGTENMAVIRYLERLAHKVLIRGNHEDMLLEIFETGMMYDHNFHNGTDRTIEELLGRDAIGMYGTVDFAGHTRTIDRVTELIGEMRNYYETEHYIFVHGWIPCGPDLQTVKNWRACTDEEWERGRWTRWVQVYGQCAVPEGKTVVCGHYPVQYGAPGFDRERKGADSSPFYGEGMIAIDAGVPISGRINVLVLEDTLLGDEM